MGYAEFSDKMNASKAKNLYHGWTGWGGRGLAIELTDFAMSQLAAMPGQKRMREGEGACRQGLRGGLGGGQQTAGRKGLWAGRAGGVAACEEGFRGDAHLHLRSRVACSVAAGT